MEMKIEHKLKKFVPGSKFHTYFISFKNSFLENHIGIIFIFIYLFIYLFIETRNWKSKAKGFFQKSKKKTT